MYWITPDGNYYEGLHVAEGSIPVTQRPTPQHMWVTDQWVIDQAAIDAANVEIKRKLLAEAMIKRDVLLVHLERLRTRAIEANDTTARDALSTAITSLENIFNDPRVVNAIDGDVKDALDECKDEIGLALVMASPSTYYALLALDAL